MTEMTKEVGRLIAGGFYDLQEIRISATNRLRVLIRTKVEDIDRSEPETKKKEKTYEKKYSDKNIHELLDRLVKEGKITDDEAQYLKDTYVLLEKSKKLENDYKKSMMRYVEMEPIYTEFLEKIKGIGAVLAANMIKEFGYCEPSTHVSSLWKYCGLDVVSGQAVRKKKGVLLTFNPRCKTLSYLIGDSFIKHRVQPYREIYDNEKRRQWSLMEHAICENCGKTPYTHKTVKGKYMCKVKKGEDKTEFKFTKYYAPQNKMHCDLRSRRKMVKVFLEHYWIKARTLKGLEINKPYPFAKMGHDEKHYIKANV